MVGAMPPRRSAEEAEALLRSFGYTPTTHYPGNGTTPWDCVHDECGRPASPRLGNLLAGNGGCTGCWQDVRAARHAEQVAAQAPAAVATARACGYEPREDFPGRSKRWRTIHVSCQVERTPTLADLEAGKGACSPCAAKTDGEARMLRNAAAAVDTMLARGLTPLVAYPGVDEEWEVRREACGHQGPTTLTQVRAGALGCATCANANRGPTTDPDEAAEEMRAAGMQPLVPFPGRVEKPWKSRHVCGRIRYPALGNIRAGHSGCGPCARDESFSRRAVPAEVAAAELLAAGYLPQERYPGRANDDWAAVHFACDAQVTVTLSRIRGGKGCCGTCGRTAARQARRLPPAVAVAELTSYGFTPLVPYPGTTTERWSSVHDECGEPATPTLSSLRSGAGGCDSCRLARQTAEQTEDPEEAAAQLRAFGYEPAVAYPKAARPWEAVHRRCGKTRHPRLSMLRQRVRYERENQVPPDASLVAAGVVGCSGCVTEFLTELARPGRVARATAKLALMGYEPVEPYVDALSLWKVRHLACDTVSPVRAAELRLNYVPCWTCRPRGFRHLAPAHLYLISDGNSHKIGVAGVGQGRITRHLRVGWQLYKTRLFNTGAQAYTVEQAVLRHLREDLGLLAYHCKETMPQGGWSETVDADEVALPDVWRVAMAIADALETLNDALALNDAS